MQRTALDLDDPGMLALFEARERADLVLLGVDPDTGLPATPGQQREALEAIEAWE